MGKKRKTCNIRTVFYYDPDYQKPDTVDTWDAEWGHKLLKRTRKDSTNPGIHPWRWFKWGDPQRQKAIEEYRAARKGFFGLEDPGPRTDLLREIGISMLRPPIRTIMAAAAENASIDDGIVDEAAPPPEGDALGGEKEFPDGPLFPGTEKEADGSTTDSGCDGSELCSDEDSSAEDDNTETAWGAATVIPAAAATRRNVPRMPLRERNASCFDHRAKLPSDCNMFNPFTDQADMCDLDYPFDLPPDMVLLLYGGCRRGSSCDEEGGRT